MLRQPSARSVDIRDRMGPPGRSEAGIALLLTVILLLLLSAMGLASLQSAQGEASAGGRSARKVRTFFAADGALSLVAQQLDQGNAQYPDTTALDDIQFVQGRAGLYTGVRTGTSDNAVPQEIRLVGRSRREGDQLNVNAGNTFSFGIYRADVVATDPLGGRTELQAQYRVSEGADTYR